MAICLENKKPKPRCPSLLKKKKKKKKKKQSERRNLSGRWDASWLLPSAHSTPSPWRLLKVPAVTQTICRTL